MLVLLGACANSQIDSTGSSSEEESSEIDPTTGGTDTATGDVEENDDDVAVSGDPSGPEEGDGVGDTSNTEQPGTESSTPVPPPEAIDSLAALLPVGEDVPPQLTAQLSYQNLDELVAQRQTSAPIERCGQKIDPTSIALDNGGESAGQRYDYGDGIRTATVQIWLFGDDGQAGDAMDSVTELRCDGLAVGNVQLEGIDFAQTDTASAAPMPATTTAGAARAEAAHFERELTSADDALLVVEDLFFEQFGPLVVFTGLREISGPGVERASYDTATLVLHRRTVERVQTELGQTPPNPPATAIGAPATAIVGIDLAAGTYRSTTLDSFCVVRRLTHPSEELGEQLDVLTWGPGEQGIVQLLSSDGVVELSDPCGTWELIDLDASPASAVDGSAPGTLIVNVDIAPGPVAVRSVGDCTIRLLSGFTGSATDLIDERFIARGELHEFTISDEAGVYLSAGCQR